MRRASRSGSGATADPTRTSAALFAGFTAYAKPFRVVIDQLGGPPGPTKPADAPATDGQEATDARH